MTTLSLPTAIDPTKTSGQYQPLASYAVHEVRYGDARQMEAASREKYDAAKETVWAALVAAGFRLFDGEWYSRTCTARIVSDYDAGTIGVEVRRSELAEFANHHLDGSYDALPLAEKHRLSGDTKRLVT